jgi:tetratricopeptide (TPR) repeat protein
MKAQKLSLEGKDELQKIFIILFLFLLSNLVPIPAIADLLIIEKEYSFERSSVEITFLGKIISFELAKGKSFETLAAYLMGQAQIKNLPITKEQISLLGPFIVSAELTEEERNGGRYFVKVRMSVDPEEILRKMETLLQNPDKIKDMREVASRADDIMKNLEKMRKELEISGLAVERNKQMHYEEAVSQLSGINWIRKAYSLELRGNYDEAVDAISRAIELNPEDAIACQLRGVFNMRLAKYEEAIANFDKVIQLKPEFAMAYVGRGVAHYELGNYEETVTNCSKAIEMHPQNACLECFYAFRAGAYEKLGKHREAIRDFDKVLEIKPDFAEAYGGRGSAYAEIGDYEQALKDYNKAIQLNPRFTQGYYDMGITFNKLGDSENSIKNMKSAARLGHKEAQQFLKSKNIRW